MKSIVATLLFALTIPARGAPFPLRSEVPVSEPEFTSFREFSRSNVHIATNGDGYLAVWTDSREGGEPSLYAARLQADGTPIDRLGLRIAHNAHAGGVVWTGSKYLIGYEAGYAYQGFVRTMTPDGVFGEPIEIGQSVSFGAMATNGTNVLLVLPQESMLLDLEGNKLKSVPVAGEYGDPSIAVVGSTYLVARNLPSVTVQTVSTDGVAGTERELASPQGVPFVGLASDGEKFLVAWPDGRIAGQFLTETGEPSGPVLTLASLPHGGWPHLGWRDGEYLLVYTDVDAWAHYAQRIAGDGTPVGLPKRLGHGAQSHVEFAAIGGTGVALFPGMQAAMFDDESLAGNDLFRRVIDVAVTARPQTNVHLARLGDGYVAAWVEDEKLFLSTAAGTKPVAVVGSSELIVDVLVDRSNVIWLLWSNDNSVAVTRFWGNLEAIDQAPIYIHTPGHPYLETAAAGDGVIALAYEVIGQDNPDQNKQDIAALLLWETGTGIARKDVLLSTAEFADYNPTVAFDGSAFVYAWSHAKGLLVEPHHQDPPPIIELVGARVSTEGELLDATPVQIADDIGSVWELDSALGANGVAIVWNAYDRPMRVRLFGGGPAIELTGTEISLGELTPHEGGFLLVRGISRRTPQLTEVEYLTLDANLAITGTGALPPYAADQYWKHFDIDAIGGASPVFAYVKSADGRYGNVPRVFVRRTGEAPPRRRALR